MLCAMATVWWWCRWCWWCWWCRWWWWEGWGDTTQSPCTLHATCCTARDLLYANRRVLRSVCRMTCSVCKSLSNVFYISGDDCYLVSLNFFQQGSITIKVTRISFSKTKDRQDIILLPLTDIEFTTRRVYELLCLPLKIMSTRL